MSFATVADALKQDPPEVRRGDLVLLGPLSTKIYRVVFVEEGLAWVKPKGEVGAEGALVRINRVRHA